MGLDVLVGALIGAGTDAGITAAEGKPVTWGSEAIGAGLGAVGGGIGGSLGGAGGAGIASTADAIPGIAGGAGDLTAGLADTAISATAPALDASTVSGLAGTGVSGGLDATTAALPGAAGPTGAALGSSMLPEQTVTAASTAPGAGVGGGGSGVAGTSSMPADFSQAIASNAVSPGAMTDIGQTLDSGGGSFLSATGASDINPLPPDIAQSLGVINPSMTGVSDLTSANPGYGPMDIADPSTGSAIEQWLSNPRNAGTAGLLGLSLKSALTQPKLPTASTTAANSATQAVQGANSVIQSGGTATPQWSSQKATIDASINQQIQQQSEAIMQAAASSGEGNANSGIVQQQIAQMTANANVQRQQLYLQAQQQNVSAALSELSGGDQVLAGIGATQLQQSEQAQQLAAQTAELALMLQAGTGGVRIPGSPTGAVVGG